VIMGWSLKILRLKVEIVKPIYQGGF